MKNKLYKLALYCKRFGWISGLQILFKIAFSPKNKLIAIQVPGLAAPVYIRARTSDEYTFQQIFVQQEYEFDAEKKPVYLLDAGANTGLAAVYFSARYPGTKITCLEPEPGNFTVLKKNIAAWPEITAVQAGLWNKSGYLKIVDQGLDNWGFTVVETDSNDPNGILAYSIKDLSAKLSVPSYDWIKMDIEGSEKEVLDAPDSAEWLSQCTMLVIELHDRMKPGTSASLFNAVSNRKYAFDVKGENLLFYFNGNL